MHAHIYIHLPAHMPMLIPLPMSIHILMHMSIAHVDPPFCICVHIHICTHVSTHVYTHVFAHVHTSAQACAFTHVRTLLMHMSVGMPLHTLINAQPDVTTSDITATMIVSATLARDAEQGGNKVAEKPVQTTRQPVPAF